MMLRSWARSIGASLAVRKLIVAAHARRLSSRPVGIAVVYHGVGRGSHRPSLELVPSMSSAVFAGQVALVKCSFTLVAASELAHAVRSHRRGRRLPLALTFDDDLKCHADVSAPRLRRFRAPATFFLGGVALDAWQGYWWDHLQAAVEPVS
jgi:hypothetical protein